MRGFLALRAGRGGEDPLCTVASKKMKLVGPFPLSITLFAFFFMHVFYARRGSNYDLKIIDKTDFPRTGTSTVKYRTGTVPVCIVLVPGTS